jgi:HD-GYP domain-containing protein (c-di-GMP phosphodiesterase class II)
MDIDLRTSFTDLVVELSRALDHSEGRFLGHAWRVGAVAAHLAEDMLPGQVADVLVAGLLHDVGAAGLARSVTDFESAEELRANRLGYSHPTNGFEIVSFVPALGRAAEFIRDHHEWADGSGHPRGLGALEIPLGAQIIRAADRFDWTLRKRPGADVDEVLACMERARRREITPQMYDALSRALRRTGLFARIVDLRALEREVRRIRDGSEDLAPAPGTDAIGAAVDMFGRLVDSKHKFMSGHSGRVTALALAGAVAMGLNHDAVTTLKWASLVHDIGRTSVPEGVFQKPGLLTVSEWRLVRSHPRAGRDMLERVPGFGQVAEIVGAHHERFDGGGYPRGLVGEAIPLESRIMAVADVYDALTHKRPYRPAYSSEQAIKMIRRDAGIEFDPDVVAVTTPVIDVVTRRGGAISALRV